MIQIRYFCSHKECQHVAIVTVQSETVKNKMRFEGYIPMGWRVENPHGNAKAYCPNHPGRQPDARS
jgi:hypothetical protein